MEAYDFRDYIRQTLHQIVKNIRHQPDNYQPNKIIIIHRGLNNEIRSFVDPDFINAQAFLPGDLVNVNPHCQLEITDPEKIRHWIATARANSRLYWIRIECPTRIDECRWTTVLLTRNPMLSFKCEIFYPRFFTGTYFEENFPSPPIINPLNF